mgnify:FL=1
MPGKAYYWSDGGSLLDSFSGQESTSRLSVIMTIFAIIALLLNNLILRPYRPARRLTG